MQIFENNSPWREVEHQGAFPSQEIRPSGPRHNDTERFKLDEALQNAKHWNLWRKMQNIFVLKESP
jgi:hypothetical protein